MTILEALANPSLFAPHFARASWRRWKCALAALFGLPLDADALEAFQRHTGRKTPPVAPFRESYFVCGRRSGKSRIAALVGVYVAAFYDHTGSLAPGERGVVAVLAADKRQARNVLDYIGGLIESTPMLAQMALSRTAEAIELSNRVVIEVHVSNYRSIRGYTLLAVIADELAFWRSEDSSNPDSEVIAAARPGLATVPRSMLIGISSPYARRGVLWDAYRMHHGNDSSPVLVWQSDSRSMNPTLDDSVIAEAYEADESAASAEYGAEFRRDIESFVSRDAVDAALVPGRFELPPLDSQDYRAFVDPSGGSADSMTLAIAHSERGVEVLDAVREWKPPFSPEAVIVEAAALLRSYGVSCVDGDRYAGEFAREPFRRLGIDYRVAEKTKSDIYRDFLPLLNSRRVGLLDHPRLVNQLIGLERRTARGGRDSIDHRPGGHDDLVNACAGVIVADGVPDLPVGFVARGGRARQPHEDPPLADSYRRADLNAMLAHSSRQ